MVFHPSRCDLAMQGQMLWFEQQLEWHVVLESAKDHILGVDTIGQYVPPRVQYGTACSLIRNFIGCVSCSVEWG
jgi:ABC-type dipeptide/oligopeptide/nickel transport system permease subunit